MSTDEHPRLQNESTGGCPTGCGRPAYPRAVPGLSNGYCDSCDVCAARVVSDAMSMSENETHDVPHVEIRRTDIRKIASVDVRQDGLSAAAKFLRGILEGKEQESFIILVLNVGGKVTAWREVARGRQDRVEVPTRELFRTALLCDAASLIISHNHPSGDPTPSEADLMLTARLRVAGESIGIPIIDHIIIGDNERYYSFQQGGHQSAKPMAMHGDREPPDF